MNLHDELGRHGADAAGDAARRLESSEVRATLGDRVRRGRRRRALAGAGTAAGVALVVVAAWTLLPSDDRDVEPAQPEITEAGPYEFELTPGSDFSRGAPQIYIKGADEVQCGDVLELTPGVTVHDEQALALEASLELGLTTEEALASDGAAIGEDGEALYPDQQVWTIQVQGNGAVWKVSPFLLDGETVVGVGLGAGPGLEAYLPVQGGASTTARVPGPGNCGQSENFEDWAPSGLAADSLVVAQLWASEDAGSEPLATVVVTPDMPPRVHPPAPVAVQTPVPDYPVAAPLVSLVGDAGGIAPLQCGDAWDLEPGDYPHADPPANTTGTVTAEFIEPQDQNPSGWKVSVSGPKGDSRIGFLAGTFAVADGVVRGVGEPVYRSNFAEPYAEYFGELPGTCGGAVREEASGEYEVHWVIQAVYLDGETWVPVETWVDPGGAVVVAAD